MKKVLKSFEKNRMKTVLLVAFGVAINVILSYVVTISGFPVYLDTIGTMLAAILGGVFPGVMTGVISNVLFTPFNQYAVYYAVLNAVIGLIVAVCNYKGMLKKFSGMVLVIIGSGIVGGVMGGLIQLLVLGKPQYSEMEIYAANLAEKVGLSKVFVFVLMDFGLNILDKAVCAFAAWLIYKLIPEKVKNDFMLAKWMQKPLSEKQIRDLSKRDSGHPKRLESRFAFLIGGAAIILTFIMGLLSVKMYVEEIYKNYTAFVVNSSEFAAKVVDGDRIEEYLEKGYEAEGYEETYNLLKDYHESTYGLQYLYVYQVKEDGCHLVFDTDSNVDLKNEHGMVIPFDEDFLQYVPALLNGERIDTIKVQSTYGYFLTNYAPIYNSENKCVAYAGADVSITFLSGYIKDYLVKAALAFSGFSLIIMSLGLRVSKMAMVYPISSMAACTESFLKDGTDQASMDKHVKEIKDLDIRTDDEVEDLYKALCKMTSDTANQVRDIRRYAIEVSQMQSGLILTMANMVENRDSDTGAHVQKTAAYVRIILDGLKKKGYYLDILTEKYMAEVETSAPLHDVGKINISDTILNKPGKLTKEEYEIMKTHALAGKKIMDTAISTVQGESYLKEARNMAAYHHEKWDGTGYPENLKGEAIPLSARIMAVADVFDALVSRRSYKEPFPFEKAMAIIEEGAGTQFDPDIARIFVESADEVRAVTLAHEQMSNRG